MNDPLSKRNERFSNEIENRRSEITWRNRCAPRRTFRDFLTTNFSRTEICEKFVELFLTRNAEKWLLYPKFSSLEKELEVSLKKICKNEIRQFSSSFFPFLTGRQSDSLKFRSKPRRVQRSFSDFYKRSESIERNSRAKSNFKCREKFFVVFQMEKGIFKPTSNKFGVRFRFVRFQEPCDVNVRWIWIEEVFTDRFARRKNRIVDLRAAKL